MFHEKIKNNINNNDKNMTIKYINCIEILEKSKQKLKKNSNMNMIIDYILINMWEEIND